MSLYLTFLGEIYSGSCFSGQHWLMTSACHMCFSHEALFVSGIPHSTFSEYGCSSSSSSTMIYLASIPSCSPHINVSSLAISFPKLVPPQKITKTQLPFPLCTWQWENAHIFSMPVSIQTASHLPHPVLPLSPFFPLLRKIERQFEIHGLSVYSNEGWNTCLCYCSSGMCLHYLNWWQSAHLSSS